MLQAIRQAMTSGDFLLFEVSTVDRNSHAAQKRRLEGFVIHFSQPLSRRQILSSLSHAEIRLEHGLIEVESQQDRSFPDLWALTQYFGFTEKHTVEYGGARVPFSNGERILVHSSYLYTVGLLMRIPEGQEFEIVKSYGAPGQARLLLCRAT